MPQSDERIHREVVSFVRRSTRMNPSQQRAWDTLRETYVVEVPRGASHTSISPDARLDWTAVFGRGAPLAVEIGGGTGHALVALAEAHPELNVVAFEVYVPSVASTMARLARHGVTNVRIIIGDGVEGLAALLPADSVEHLWTFFPDPWHKSRHHKRRLVSTEFAALVATRLTPTGAWHLATDWEDYAEAMREVLDEHLGLANVHDDWAPRLDERPVTKYERRGMDAGRTIRDLTYRRAG